MKDTKSVVFQMRMLPENKALFEGAAKKLGLSLAEWFSVAGFEKVARSKPSVFDGSKNDPLIKSGALKEWDQFEPKPPVIAPPKSRPPKQKARPPVTKAEKPVAPKKVKTFFKEKWKVPQ